MEFHETRAGVGDVVLINRLAYDIGKPIRFDVVVFEQEGQQPGIKRIIGLPVRQSRSKMDPSISMGNS